MDEESCRTTTLRRGRNLGAAAGAVAFLGPGLLPSLFVVNYGIVLLAKPAARLVGEHLEPGILFRVALGLGTAFGVLAIGALLIAVGAIAGTAVAYSRYLAGFSPELFPLPGPSTLDVPFLLPHQRIPGRQIDEIKDRLSFLQAAPGTIRGVAVVGSAAYGHRRADSDIDIVVICAARDTDGVREFVFGREIDDAMAEEPGMADLEFTVISEREAESLLAEGSPFAWAIRHGVHLEDDGFLRELGTRPAPRFPRRDYYLKVLYENVAVQYLGSLTTMEGEIERNQCTDACCRDRAGCSGLSSPETVVRTTMRMLYAVLSARGYVPLTKGDTMRLAGLAFDGEPKRIVTGGIPALRAPVGRIYYGDYKPLKDLARYLFRELVKAAGTGGDVRRILADAGNMVRGRYADVRDPGLRGCVLPGRAG